jgi:EAL domain-containing protein (putative c-di-GMP-specific phosphodiesterase class I)
LSPTTEFHGGNPLAQLSRLGCLAGQGFLLARPMDPTDAEAYLRRMLRAAPLERA